MHKALGRGLESLLQASTAPAAAAGEIVTMLQLDKIKPNRFQARVHFDPERLKELAESIKNHGLAQPLLVAASAVPGEFELIAGERRWRASQMAGLKEVAAIVRKANDKERFELSLIENIQRENLNAIEEAKAYKRLGEEYNLTQEELAKVLGKDRSVIANLTRLLALPQDIQDAIAQGVISSGHGKILAGVEDTNKQKQLAERILKEKLTVREVEQIAADWKSVISQKVSKAKKSDAELTSLADELQRKFGTKVKIIGKPKKGKIEIHYFSLKELERIALLLKGKTGK